ncbi:hypothetical protein [Phenylobacterium sp.]|uniref:hypothetical protein n=1 Tax=Phenylobacterium sp. TaxID=1871053 RepID=UPI00391C9F3B
MMSIPKGSRAFRWGVLLGFAAPTVMVVGLMAYLGQYDLEATARGADLTRHGAAKVVVADGRGWEVTQSCVGACDDLHLKARVGESGPTLRVFGVEGRTIAAGGVYVPGGHAMSRLDVVGGDRLRVEPSGHVGYR